MADVIYKRLKELRKRSGYTQREVAIALYLPLRTYQNYERGVNAPDIAMVCNMADLYGVSVDYLVGHETRLDQVESVNLVLLDDSEHEIIAGYRRCNGQGRATLSSIVHAFTESRQFGLK